MGNGRQNHKFSSPKNRGGILLYCAGADGHTLVIPEVYKMGKILYVHLYREKWYRKVA